MGDPLAPSCWYPFLSLPCGILLWGSCASLYCPIRVSTLSAGTVDMDHLEGRILFLTDHCPTSVVLSPHHTEFVLKGVLRGKVEALISVDRFLGRLPAGL